MNLADQEHRAERFATEPDEVDTDWDEPGLMRPYEGIDALIAELESVR